MVYAVIEPDVGGEALKEKLAVSPALHDRLRLVELRVAVAKDVSELHLSDSERFKKRLRTAFGRAALWTNLERAEADARTRESWEACRDWPASPHPRPLRRRARALRRRRECAWRSSCTSP